MCYFAIFKDGLQISKAYASKETAIIHAVEQGLVYFARAKRYFQEGVEIRPVDPED